eukprot:5531457-Lingulodinium_polyedra.AAC.1
MLKTTRSAQRPEWVSRCRMPLIRASSGRTSRSSASIFWAVSKAGGGGARVMAVPAGADPIVAAEP